MFDTAFRQLVFGPKYGGIPLTAWQKFYRGWQVEDRDLARQKPSFLESAQRAFFFDDPNAGHWERLSGEDRRAILLTLADDPKELVRVHVAGHLGDVPASPEVLAQLKRYTQDKHRRVRQYAARSLGKSNPPVTDLVPDLIKLLDDPDEDVRDAARQAGTKIASRVPEVVVPQLLPLIPSPNEEKRLLVLHVLTGMKSAVPEAVPTVREALQSPDWQIRVQALRLLGLMKVKEAVPQITAALRDRQPEVRASATRAIGYLGPDAKAAIPHLLRHVQALPAEGVLDEPPQLTALGYMGEAAREAIPELLKLREHASPTVRQAVEKTLSQIDPKRFPPVAEPK